MQEEFSFLSDFLAAMCSIARKSANPIKWIHPFDWPKFDYIPPRVAGVL